MKSFIIDEEEKNSYFNVQYVDLNNDGKKDILATTNTANGKGAVFAFELVGDYTEGPSAWKKHKLSDGYKPRHAFLPG